MIWTRLGPPNIASVMNTLYYLSDIEDCFLSAKDGTPIVKRFGLRLKSKTEHLELLLRELAELFPQLVMCAFISADGFYMAGLPGRQYFFGDEEIVMPFQLA